jgi:hypothetical protein
MVLLASYAPRNQGDGVCWGGTAIVIPWESLERRANESLDDAIGRITRTKNAREKGRITTANVTVDGKPRKLISAYAPATSGPDKPRTAFFNALEPLITKRTVMGIDANSVPDPSLDLKRDATSPYENEGWDALQDAIEKGGLIDAAREQLGSDPFFTAHHVTAAGECWARLDRIYVPDDPHMSWTHSACDDFFPSRANRVELDHVAIHVHTTQHKPERGHDVKRIDESIYLDPPFAARVAQTIARASLAAQDGARKAWGDLRFATCR